jgi:hypothetical protein
VSTETAGPHRFPLVAEGRTPASGPATVPEAGHGYRPAEGVTLAPLQLVIGYLAAVALRLEERGTSVRALRVAGPGVAGPGVAGPGVAGPGVAGPGAVKPAEEALGGELTLTASCAAVWAPTRLCWSDRDGWTARLHATEGAQRRGAAVRYLPGAAVPAPITVARFLTALCTNPETTLACATLRRVQPVDRRCTILQLSRYALLEPR